MIEMYVRSFNMGPCVGLILFAFIAMAAKLIKIFFVSSLLFLKHAVDLNWNIEVENKTLFT